MVESGMSLPMGEDHSAPLITEVLSLLLPYAIPILSLILPLVLLGITIYSLFTAFVFTQALQKIRLVNHICSLAEFLHANVMQQLMLALLGSPVARLLDVLAMGIQHHTTSSHSTSVPLCPPATSSMLSSLPSVPIAGITDMEGPAEAKASTSTILPPTMSTDVDAVSTKCHQIMVPAHALSKQINCPGSHKDYRCQLCAFQHTNKDCMLMHI